MRIERTGQRLDPGVASIMAIAAVCSIAAAAVHAVLAPEHFREWWGYGLFFVLVTAVQGAYGAGLVLPRLRLSSSPVYLLAGIAFNIWIAGLYAVTRTSGIPLIGPHAGHVEALEMAGALSAALELGTVVALGALLVWDQDSRTALRRRQKTAVVVLSGITTSVALMWALASLQDRLEFRTVLGLATAAESRGTEVPADNLPSYVELYKQLSRSGEGPGGVALDAFYAPAVYFQVAGTEAPEASHERPTLVFVLQEADHVHITPISGEPLRATLSVDGGAGIQPYDVSVLYASDEHRTTQFLFPFPKGVSQNSLNRSAHELKLSVPVAPGQVSEFAWQVPLVWSDGAAAEGSESPVGAETAAVPAPQVSALAKVLGRSTERLDVNGASVRVEAIYATSAYLGAAFPADVAARFQPEKYATVLITEVLHSADLTSARPEAVLTMDGRRYSADLIEDVASSQHHRVTLMRFPAEAPGGLRHHAIELSVPGGASMEWHFPLSYGSAATSSGGLQVTWVWLLAILGGLIAAMWPCLFQLTVFFIPALAGISMHDASSNVTLVKRAAVVKAALFFVLGFTIVYTVAGGLIGYFAGRLSSMEAFYAWQQWLGIAGGIVILVLAVRVAAQVRAPLVCKMPVLSGMGKNKGAATPLQMMIAGVAFATGCMTCFGAAVVVAMVVYVGLSGSAFIGAFTLFLFALGMGVPLVIASTAMAKVMPLLTRFEKAVRWMGVASTLVMVGIAVLLITGNYMALTEWIYRILPS